MKDKICAKSPMLNDEYFHAVDRQMCTAECPCSEGINNETRLSWESKGDDHFREYNRTIKATASEKNLYRIMKDEAEVIPMVF